ncbi:hypothetical protein IHQ68_04440 [Chelatococcus sambhunathii]|uniref:Uncharacterized protein n=1 Tax=Chelatococcus sambhunathii TaxID=363953 RepID=A0ABU1DCP6_9HYPH|nr:hypothetical protein [Chelatococcus sambhunathii]MDR4305874.1 hypothetical protein [Chelatococcus sambhunathii]
MSALKTNGAEVLAASATDTPTWADTFTADHDIAQGRGETDEPRVEMTVEGRGRNYRPHSPDYLSNVKAIAAFGDEVDAGSWSNAEKEKRS